MIRGRAALAVLASAWLLAGCGTPTAERIVLLTLDTTRADHLGCYGYAQGATPSLDALAAEAALFEQAMTPVPVTLPAHASIFTGLYPAQHGVRYNGMFRLDASHRTLATILKEAGFATVAVPASFAVAGRFGMGQGFEEYLDLFSETGKKQNPDQERKADDVAKHGIAALARAPQKLFLWLHFYDPHWRYQPPFPFSVQFRDRPYDGEIAFMDREIGKVLAALRADAARWDRTLVVVVGDHGEGLYEHREMAHGTLTYQSTLHVPLLIKPPGGRSRERVAEGACLVDLLPTVLDYAGLPVPSGVAGVSLRPALEGRRSEPRALYFEALAGALNYGWSSLEGVRRGNWKLIAGVDPELYDLAHDPGEEHNLHANDRTRADDLQQELDEALALWNAGADSAQASVQMDAETLERLASLGYVGVGGSELERAGVDPKSMIHLENEILEAQFAIAHESWDDAIRACEYVLQHDPLNQAALTFLTRARLESGKTAAARESAEKLAHHYPSSELAHDLLGQSFRALGARARVVEVYEAGTALCPDSSLLNFRLTLAFLEAGQRARACGRVDEGLARWPKRPEFLLMRARCQVLDGRLDEAVASLRESRARGLDPAPFVEQEPDLAPLRGFPAYRELVGTGTEPGLRGQEPHFRQCVSQAPVAPRK